jgi:hypothetical protein
VQSNHSDLDLPRLKIAYTPVKSSAIMSSRSKQDIFAENLKGDPMGMALFYPLPLRPGIRDGGNVGDIAFFNSDGHYLWVSNAFCSDNVMTLLSI